MKFGNIRTFLNINKDLITKYSSRFVSSDIYTQKTSLYNFHISNNGKIVNFAGYLLPVQYADLGISASHLHTRLNASIFDVSHMLQTEIKGTRCIEWFESLCTADITGLSPGSGTLTVFTNERGGILDDLIVTKINDQHLYVVSNAGRKNEDKLLMQNSLESFRGKNDTELRFYDSSEKALLAVQGPTAVSAVQPLTDINLDDLYFMNSVVADVAGVADCRITRCGYTGEDGVEISIPAPKASEVATALLNSKQHDVKLAGLGARDSLRLEAGLCLHGHDIEENTSPVEAGLSWLVAKRRRTEMNFPGSEVILRHLQGGCTRRRVGLKLLGGPPARQGTKIYKLDRKTLLGHVTSGGPSPSLNINIAMGYVPEDFKKLGTEVCLKVRDNFVDAVVTKMPFTETHYYTKPKNNKT